MEMYIPPLFTMLMKLLKPFVHVNAVVFMPEHRLLRTVDF
jgi:hypothetical protein